MTASNRELIRRALINVKLREVAEMDRIAVSEKNISEDSLTRLRVQVMMRIKSAKPKISNKVFFIAAVIAAVFALVGCAIAIGEFVIKDFEDGRGTIFDSSGMSEKNSFEEFYIIDVPQEFAYDYGYDFSKIQSYVFKFGKKEIIFQQNVTQNSSFLLDTEYNEYTQKRIGTFDVYYVSRNGYHGGIWLYDGYTFALTVKGGLDYDDFVSIIESVHIAEPGEIEAIRIPERTEYSTQYNTQ